MPRRPQVRESATERLPEAEPGNDVLGGDRIIEVLSVVVDPGQAWALQELRPEHLLPHPFDLLQFREEPVTAEVEPVAVELDRLRNATHGPVGFEDCSRATAPGESVGRGQPGRAGSEDRSTDRLTVLREGPRRWRDVLGLEFVDPRVKLFFEVRLRHSCPESDRRPTLGQ